MGNDGWREPFKDALEAQADTLGFAIDAVAGTLAILGPVERTIVEQAVTVLENAKANCEDTARRIAL